MFDEPTTGLHFDDVAKLLRAFRKLLAAGHSLLVIEHNLDVIRASDWLIDLGPEGGDTGGRIVATGTPDQLANEARTHTGKALAEYAKAMNGDRFAGAIPLMVSDAAAAQSAPPGIAYLPGTELAGADGLYNQASIGERLVEPVGPGHAPSAAKLDNRAARTAPPLRR